MTVPAVPSRQATGACLNPPSSNCSPTHSKAIVESMLDEQQDVEAPRSSPKRKQADSPAVALGDPRDALTEEGSAPPSAKRHKKSPPVIGNRQEATGMVNLTSRLGRPKDSATTFVKATWVAATDWSAGIDRIAM
ncbi:hypothetical protein FRB97_004984 [Tulasnella sp. 331]|nr:hypothetical protein FRB97_004984 [Tulasnella sp. 331]